MSTNVSAVTEHFPSPQDGFSTTLASTISSGATTVPLNSVAGYINGQIGVFVVDPSSTTAKQAFTGIIDTAGIQVTNVVWTTGTNQVHSGGATIVDYATATHIAMISAGILKQHNQDGTHTGITTDTITTTTLDVTSTITIPGSSITTPSLNNASITADKLALGPAKANVDTSETTTSTSYTALATAQALTVTVGANGILLIGISAGLYGVGGNQVFLSYQFSGANTSMPADRNGITSNNVTTDGSQYGNTVLFTGLAAGATTVTLVARVGGSTGTFKNRSLWAIPL